MDSGSPSYPSLAWNSVAQRDIRGQQECLLALASAQHFLPPHHTRACSVTVHSASLFENSNCHYHRGSRAEIFIFLGKGCLFIMGKCQVYSLTRCLHRIIFRRTGNKSFIANQRQVKQREKKCNAIFFKLEPVQIKSWKLFWMQVNYFVIGSTESGSTAVLVKAYVILIGLYRTLPPLVFSAPTCLAPGTSYLKLWTCGMLGEE